jgi:hypothetical protein
VPYPLRLTIRHAGYNNSLNFFKMITDLLKRIKNLNINIDLIGDQLDIKAAKGIVTNELLYEIKYHKKEIIDFIVKYKKGNKQHSLIPAIRNQSDYPLSSNQYRLWVLSQLEEGNIAYTISGIYTFTGELDRAALTYSFKALQERHESLRTVFEENEQGEIRQFIVLPEKSEFIMSYLDLRQEENVEEIIKKRIQLELIKPFNLASDPLLRTNLFQITDNKWVFTYTIHHIISDAWSVGILISELLIIYNAYIKGEDHLLKPLDIQYKDYAVWQKEQLKGESLKDHKAYWLNQFEGELPVLEFPNAKIRPSVKTFNGGRINKILETRISDRLKTLSRELGGTLFMGLLTVVNTLLYRYTRQEDIIIGSPIAGREHSDLEDQIGFYVNTLALRTRFKGKNSYKELLENIKGVTLKAYEHQMYPFDELVDALHLQRDISRHPLFDVMVLLQNTLEKEKVKDFGNAKVEAFDSAETLVSKFDLSFRFEELEARLNVTIDYNSDLFDRATALLMGDHLEQLMDAIIKQPSTPIQELDYLSSTEKQKLLVEFNKTIVNGDIRITDLFEEQVLQTPNNIAFVFKETAFTYKELNEKSNKLGHYLKENYKIKANDLIGIKLDPNEWMIVAILAVMKTGGAYLPVGTGYSQQQIEYIIADSKCRMIIDQEELKKFSKVTKKYAENNLKSINQPGNLASVIYTSGSTNKPDQVMINNNSLVHHAAWNLFDYSTSENYDFSNFPNIVFDMSVDTLYQKVIAHISNSIFLNTNVESVFNSSVSNEF